MNHTDGIKEKIENLEKAGWKKLEPQLDFGHLVKLGPEKVLKELGFFISDVVKQCTDNPMALFSKEFDTSKTSFINKITPSDQLEQYRLKEWPKIRTHYPSQKDQDDTAISKAFEALQYITIRNIVNKVLPSPTYIFQEFNNTVFQLENTKSFNIESLELVYGNVTCYWPEYQTYLDLFLAPNWGENQFAFSIVFNFHCAHLNKFSEKALKGVGVEINPQSFQVGNINAQFKLSSYPEYIKEYTEELKLDMGLLNNSILDRYNLLIVGSPGKGKTQWSHSFSTEVLAPLGYLILSVDYSSLQNIIIPNFIDKVCIIVNDADTLALKRTISQRGETEQILSWLDGTRSTFIQPFNTQRSSSIITLMNANTVENWDEAALRKGRIHSFKAFEGETLADL